MALKDDIDSSKRKFAWKWQKGILQAMQGDFGDPVNGTTAYTLCVYDQSAGSPVFKMGTTIAPGGMCGTEPCWKALGDKGWTYKNKTGNGDGVTKVKLKAGAAGQPQLQVQAKGASLPLPGAISGLEFFDQDPTVIVQLHSSSPGGCWSSTFDGSSTKKNVAAQFKAVTP